MTYALTQAEVEAMEQLLGALVDHCDPRQQRLVLQLHQRLHEIYHAQRQEHKQLVRLRSLSSAGDSRLPFAR